MKQIFISYSSKDATQANEIVEALEKKGITCWIAPRDMHVGCNYTKDIPSAIRDCRFFLLVLSRRSQESKWVNKELTRAINQDKHILPIMIEDFTVEEGFQFLLEDVQTCYYYQEKTENLDKLIDEICGLFPQATPIPATASKLAELSAEECYERGKAAHHAEKYTDAVTWYLMAAKQGYPNAQYCLGLCYANGWGVTLSHETAVEWYRKAANNRHTDAQYCLGLCYANGWGVTLNHEIAVEWYHKAAVQEHADAQYCLGLCYSNGWGVVANNEIAAEWYQKSAEQGNADAQTNLGYCYETGSGVSPDCKTAVMWYRKAAEQGHSTAQYALGSCYRKGDGVTQDDQIGIMWYQKAAEQGHSGAQYNLAHCYQYGWGVDVNLSEAKKWYQKLADKGDRWAKIKIRICEDTEQKIATNGKKQTTDTLE